MVWYESCEKAHKAALTLTEKLGTFQKGEVNSAMTQIVVKNCSLSCLQEFVGFYIRF